MIKKKIFSIITLCVFLIAGFIYLNKIYKTEERYEHTVDDFKSLAKNTNIDILFFGSSMSHTAYNPLVINHYTESISYNLGSDALRIPISDLIFQEALNYTSPRLIVIEVHQSSIKYPEANDENIKGLQLVALDFVSNMSINKINTIYDIYGKEKILPVMFPLIRNHTKWDEFDLFNRNKRIEIDTSRYYYFGGHFGLINPIDEAKFEEFKNFKSNPIRRNRDIKLFSKKEKQNFVNFINRAKDRDIEVLIVSSPFLLARYNEYSFFDEINRMSDSLKVNYINLNDYYEEIGIKFSDFSDKSHLSEKGSIKTSKFISNYINENYSLNKRSSEEIWINTDRIFRETYDKYAEIDDQSFQRDLKFELHNGIELKNIKIIKNRRRKDFLIEIAFPEEIKNELSNYKMAVNIFPKEEEIKLIDETRRELSKFFDQADIQLINNNDSIKFRVNTNVENFKEVKIFLYNAENYDGVIGSPLMIKDISFE